METEPTFNDAYASRRWHHEASHAHEDEGSLISEWQPDLRLLGRIELLGAEEVMTVDMRMEKVA